MNARVLALSALAGCAPPELVVTVPVLPAGVDRIAVLVTDRDGAVVGASGLLAADRAPQRFEVEQDDDLGGAWMIGHGARSLPLGLRPPDATLAGDGLRLAGALEPALPAPEWVGRGALEGSVIAIEASTEPPPRVTAAWLSRCPILLPSGVGVVDISCKEQACPAVAEQVGCTFTIDASACTYGSAGGTVGSDGAITIDPSTQLGVCDGGRDGPEPGSIALSCDLRRGGMCPLIIYPQATAPQFATTALELGPGRLTRPDFARPPFGFLPGAAASGETLFVSVLERAADKNACDAVGSSLAIVETSPSPTVRTATAPACLVHLAPDPIRPGGPQVLGVYRDRGWHIARFSRAGRRLAGRALGIADADVVVEVAVDPPTAGTPEVLLLVQSSTSARVELLDARTLALRVRFELGAIDARAAILSPTTFAVLEDLNDQLWIFDRALGVRTRFYDIRGNNPPEGMARVVAFGADHVITASGRLGGVKIGRPGLLRTEPTRPFEAYVQPYGLGLWPSDPDRLLIGLTGIFDDARLGLAPDRTEAYVTLLDPVGARLLPNMTRIGRGPVEHVLATPEGKGVWVTLPWESTLVHVAPP